MSQSTHKNLVWEPVDKKNHPPILHALAEMEIEDLADVSFSSSKKRDERCSDDLNLKSTIERWP